jgi:hypothetical protein
LPSLQHGRDAGIARKILDAALVSALRLRLGLSLSLPAPAIIVIFARYRTSMSSNMLLIASNIRPVNSSALAAKP